MTLLLLLSTLCLFPSEPDAATAWWPAWRGPGADGVAAGTPPTRWSETDNVTWKKAIPGAGLATPVIWGDALYLLTAEETDRKAEAEASGKSPDWANPKVPDHYRRFNVLALNRKTGEPLWRQTAAEQLPHEAIHSDSSWASNSPATDGTCLVASFGSVGIFCYEMNGTPRWQVDLGDMHTRNHFGEGSSPLVIGDVVVIVWDHEEASFITALDKTTGAERWRVARDEPTSWTTPVAAEVDGKTQVVVSATNRIRGYDPADGRLIWECAGMTLNAIPSPIARGSRVYAASGFRGNALLALELAGARGDLTDGPHVKGRLDRDTPYVPSILLSGEGLYFLKHNKGIVSRINATSFAPDFGPERLEGLGGVYASPVAAGGHVYILGRDGKTAVIKDGPAFEQVALNSLDDRFDASPAAAGNALYLRGHQYLYCIGTP